MRSINSEEPSNKGKETSMSARITIIVAIIGLIGTLGAAYFSYLSSVSPIRLIATWTAEAHNTSIPTETQLVWTPTSSFSQAPTNLSSTETLTLVPPSENPDLAIDEFAFCEVQDFDSITNKCKVSQAVFLQGTTKFYVSWKYKGNYQGTYSRQWYTNGTLSTFLSKSGKEWKSDGETDSTSVTYLAGLQPGEYKVEFRLDSNNQLIFEASFIVQ